MAPRTPAEQEAISNAASRGVFAGGIRWGVYASGLAITGQAFSPVYRSLTLQYKVFLQLACMMAGAWVEADESVRRLEKQMRLRKKLEQQAAVKNYEEVWAADSENTS